MIKFYLKLSSYVSDDNIFIDELIEMGMCCITREKPCAAASVHSKAVPFARAFKPGISFFVSAF
jgi:hypothetical protein